MRDYVEKTLHTKVESKPVEVSALPLYLRGLYSLEPVSYTHLTLPTNSRV